MAGDVNARRAAFLAVIAIVTVLAPDRAWARPQISVRLAGGVGDAPRGALPDDVLFELALRGEALFGAPGDRSVRVGPAVELRTDDFVTAEAAGGLSLLLPIAMGYPIVLTAGLGWASRPGNADAPFALGIVAWGYRSYDYASSYAFALQLYAATHVDLDAGHLWSVTGGIEVDLEIFAIPFIAAYTWLTRRGDPDEGP